MKHIRRTQPVGAACRLRYFTMIEVLAVIAIILILVGLSFGAYNAVQKSRANARTESNLSTLNVALQAFKTKYGYYPQTEDKYVAVVVSKGLPTTGKKQVSSTSKYISSSTDHLVFGADFIKFLSSEILKSAVADGEINNTEVLIIPDGYKDPVANNPTNISKALPLIYYRCPGSVNKDSYDLFSAGPDRGAELGTSYDETKKENKDNIWPQNQKKISGTK